MLLFCLLIILPSICHERDVVAGHVSCGRGDRQRGCSRGQEDPSSQNGFRGVVRQQVPVREERLRHGEDKQRGQSSEGGHLALQSHGVNGHRYLPRAKPAKEYKN